jgi:TetR/AcrR family fatty acid metabolism transcriptional regulator
MGSELQSASVGRRERVKQEREGRILDAAAAVFADKGFHRATIHEIAELADVADGTIYNYFESKFDLLVEIMARVAELERFQAQLVQALDSDVRDFFVTAFDDRLEYIEQAEEMLQAVLPEVFVNPRLREQFYRQYVLRTSVHLEGFLQAQVELGHIRPINVPLAVRMVQGMFVGLLVLRILGDEMLQSRWHDVPEIVATMMYDGLKGGAGD